MKKVFIFSFFLLLTCGLFAQTKEEITKVQQALATLGYKPGVVDGIWGSKTTTAIKLFQSDENLVANGKLDSLTNSRLFASSNVMTKITILSRVLIRDIYIFLNRGYQKTILDTLHPAVVHFYSIHSEPLDTIKIECDGKLHTFARNGTVDISTTLLQNQYMGEPGAPAVPILNPIWVISEGSFRLNRPTILSDDSVISFLSGSLSASALDDFVIDPGTVTLINEETYVFNGKRWMLKKQ